jgi:hypothetical protein
MKVHRTNLGQHIPPNNINILAKKSRHKGQLIREAKDIKLHSNNMHSVDRYSQCRLWKYLVHSLFYVITNQMLPPKMILLYPSPHTKGYHISHFPFPIQGGTEKGHLFPIPKV